MDKLKKAVKVIAIIVILVLVVSKIKSFLSKTGSGQGDEVVGPVYTIDDIKAAHEGEMSDIEGWTVNDKIDAGLSWVDGSDTDADGLTDKEEIEVYGSDPKKNSTSGDFYPDGYKVAHDMDLKTSYEYKDDIEYKMVSSDDIKLTAKSSEDFNAVASEISNANIEGYTVYKTYDIYFFGGNLELDISDLNEAEDVDMSKLVVLVGPWHDGDMEKAKVEKNGNKLTVKYNFDSTQRYNVVVGKDNNPLDFKKPYHRVTYNAVDDGNLMIGRYMYVHFFRFLSIWFHTKPSLYMVKTGNAENDEFTAEFLVAIANYFGEGYSTVTTSDIRYISDSGMDFLEKFMNLFGKYEVYYGATFPGVFIAWCTESRITNEQMKNLEDTFIADKSGTTNEKPLRSNTGFDVGVDALPFQNYHSVYTRDGNCAGISYLTAALYNNGSMPTKGGYFSDYDNEDYMYYLDWDIAGDPDNSTLTDKVLYDYKTSDFVNVHEEEYDHLTGLTEGEDQFVRMIAAYFKKTNDVMNGGIHCYPSHDNYGYQKWEFIETITDRLDKGEILVFGTVREDVVRVGADIRYYAHAMNIVDYEKSEDGNTVVFTIYDCNYPNNMFRGNTVNNKLIVSKTHCASGNLESFSYYYRPYLNAYAYDSESKLIDFRNFVVMDSNFNVIVW